MAFVRPLQGRSVSSPVGVVIVDADPGQRRSLAGMIAAGAGERFRTRAVASAAEARAAADAEPGTIVIADLETIGGPGGLPAFAPGARTVIATSADVSLSTAIAAVRGGAADFLPKPIGARVLIERLEATLAGWPTSAPAAAPPRPAIGDTATDFAGFIGRSPAMRAVYDQIRRVAPSKAPVFITGESGTGKELVAEALHQHAGANGRPFVAINCSAIPRDLMESEIFGHVRGAFTGAVEDRPGAAELANGGTLFLDEIAEMDLGLQAKLLRFLQTGAVRRIGGSTVKQVDVRILSATNRDPFVEVESGRFRADLFYRLHVLPIHLVPLRQRPDDIAPLADAFLARFAAEEGRAFTGFEPAAMAVLNAYAWPGNVRQLANAVRRAVVLDEGPQVSLAALPEPIRPAAAPFASDTGSQGPARGRVAAWRDQERAIIETAVAACGGNVAQAAAALEISPSTIYRKRLAWAPGQPASA